MNLTATHYIILAIAYFAVLVILGILSVKRKEKIRTAEEENRAYRNALIFMTTPLLLPIFIWMVGGIGFVLLYVLLEFMPNPNSTVLTIILIIYAVIAIFFGIKAYITIQKSIYKLYENKQNKA